MTARSERLLRHIRQWATSPSSSASDSVLLDRFIRHRDEASFAALVDRHAPMVLGVCRRILGNVHDAEDALQAAFLVLARKAASVQPRHALSAFLYGVARRVALKARAANARRTCAIRALSTPPVDPHASLLDELSARELLTIFDEELQRLPSAYRLPLILCCLEGRSQEDAAEQLGWTPGSVRGRLERGRRRLHSRLVRRGVALSAALMAVEASRLAAEASIPLALSTSITRATLTFATGRLDGAGAALAELTLKGMAWSKGAWIAGLLTIALSLVGLGVLAHPMLAGKHAETSSPNAPPAEQPDGEAKKRIDRHGDPLPPGAIARLGTQRFRGVRGSLAFSPDGKVMAAATGLAGEDITFWDAISSREVRQIKGSATLSRLVFSPDGKRLVRSTNRCQMLDAASGKVLFAVEGVYAAFSGDGKLLVTADAFDTKLRVYVWDAATGRQLRQSPQEGNALRELTVAAQGRTLAVLESNGLVVTIRDIATGEKIRTIRNTEVIRGANMPNKWHYLALTRDGKTLATVHASGVQLWDIASGEYVAGWNSRLQSRPVFSPDGKRIAWVGSGNQGGPARLWLVERDNGKPKAIGDSVNNFEPPCFSPDGKLLAVVTDAHVVSLRDVASGKETVSFDAHTRPVIDLAFSGDGRQVVSRGDNNVFAWEARTGRLLHRASLLPSGHEYVAPLMPYGFLLTGERTKDPLQGRFWLRDMRTGEEVMRFDGRPDVGPPNAVAAPGGRFVAVRGRAGEICVLHVKARRCIFRLDPKEAASGLQLSVNGDVLVWYVRAAKGIEIHVHHRIAEKTIVLRDLPKNDRVVWCLDKYRCVSPDGRCFILPTADRRLRRWDLTSGKELSPLTDTLQTIWDLDWSPDGRFVAAHGSGSAPNVIDREALRDVRVWDVRTGARLQHLTVPNRNGGMHVLISHDSRTMFTTDLAGIIYLREVATGKERGRLKGHLPYEIGSLALSPDGRMLVSGGYDSQAFVWDLTGRAPDGEWHFVRHPPEKLRAAWEALAGNDAKVAYAAIWQLVADPEGSTSLLRERLRPIARPKPGRVARLIADLDSEEFAVRQRAERELESLEEVAASEMRQSLTRKPSLEVRRRIEALLEKLNQLPIGRQLQALRAVEVLEHIGTPEGRMVLTALAEGAPDARVTREAKATLRRLPHEGR